MSFEEMNTKEETSEQELQKKESIDDFDSAYMWNSLLELFGTEEARENFKKLCIEYQSVLAKRRVEAQQSAAGFDVRATTISGKGQAELHNKIMHIINTLLTQATISLDERKKFNPLANRKMVAKMIDDVFGFYSQRDKKKIERMTEMGRFRKGDF